MPTEGCEFMKSLQICAFEWWGGASLNGYSRFQCPVLKWIAVLGITGLFQESSHSFLTFKTFYCISSMFPKVLIIQYYKNMLGDLMIHPTVKKKWYNYLLALLIHAVKLDMWQIKIHSLFFFPPALPEGFSCSHLCIAEFWNMLI